MPILLTGIIPEDRLNRIRAIEAGDPVQGGQPEPDGMGPNDNNHVFDLACTALFQKEQIAKFGTRDVYFEYDPNHHYLPFDRVILREVGSLRRDVYQVYNPNGCINIDPTNPHNRPTGWNNTDPTKPYHWIRLGLDGERGPIGGIRIAMSHERRENEIPFVGGTFSLKAGLIPWMYESLNGTPLSSVTEEVKFGMRENDFMRFISSSNARALLSQQADATQRVEGRLGSIQHAFDQHDQSSGALFNEFGGMYGSYALVNNGGNGIFVGKFDNAKVVRTSTEEIVKNSALTAFIII